MQAAETLAAEGIDVEVIDLRWIRPIDIDTVRTSVAKTGRLVVVEEQVHAGGWGATVVSQLAMEGTAFRRPPVAVSLPPEMLIPYSPPLEDQLMPSAARIAEAVRGAASG
jgi:pyruvate/2-oxoglutarate/acetoin dehydrogenase E1 component